MSQAAHEPTDETRAQVKALAQFLTQQNVADFLEISVKTLVKHYREELDRGKVRANAKVGMNLFAFASGAKGSGKEQITAGIFWMKTQAGWRETVDVNHQHAFIDGARERLAGKLGGAIPARGEESAPAIPPAIGTA
jgi:hypothetical protein